ncbi:MAG: phosphatase PAP2 family protein [Streptomyces sp.]|nr:phosphatase PAP2 family protein [Streptomyces sp.]
MSFPRRWTRFSGARGLPPPHRGVAHERRPSASLGRTAVLFALVIGAYTAVFTAVLARSPLLEFDWRLALWQPYKQWPQLRGFLDVLVVAGQRGPTTTAALAWLGWRSWRSRNPRPLLVFLTALVLLNVSVGAVKLATGRLGPHYAYAIGSTELFRGGDMFPSGHTANSVVIWGTLAYLAGRHRRAAGVLAALAALAVGLTTVYLGTHWFSDALGGWAAGALVLLALPRCEPFVGRVGVRLRELWARWRADSVSRPVPEVAVPARMPTERGRGGAGAVPSPSGAAPSGPSSCGPASRQVSPATATAACHPRVWNERGPPRVPGMS